MAIRARSVADGRFIRTDPTRRFYASVSPGADSGCWLWIGARDFKGYGVFYLNGKKQRAHRVSWRLAGGDVPAGMELDHLCRNRRCVNPGHLDLVTHQENMRRSVRARFTTCPNGHELTAENTRWQEGGRRRRCRTCYRKAVAA